MTGPLPSERRRRQRERHRDDVVRADGGHKCIWMTRDGRRVRQRQRDGPRRTLRPNTSATNRTGTVTIAGKTYTVTQAGVSCTLLADTDASASAIAQRRFHQLQRDLGNRLQLDSDEQCVVDCDHQRRVRLRQRVRHLSVAAGDGHVQAAPARLPPAIRSPSRRPGPRAPTRSHLRWCYSALSGGSSRSG